MTSPCKAPSDTCLISCVTSVGPAKSSLPTYIFVGFSTFPRKRMDSVLLSESSIRKGWLKEMTEEGLSFERTISLVVVAAAASVPSSLTSSTAL